MKAILHHLLVMKPSWKTGIFSKIDMVSRIPSINSITAWNTKHRGVSEKDLERGQTAEGSDGADWAVGWLDVKQSEVLKEEEPKAKASHIIKLILLVYSRSLVLFSQSIYK